MPKSTPSRWTPQEDAFLRQHPDWSHQAISAVLGRSVKGVRNRCWRLGLVEDRFWSDADVRLLVDAYTAATGFTAVNIVALAQQLGRDKANVARKARSLGLTDRRRRRTEAQSAAQGIRVRDWLAANPHPRGATGLRHSAAARRLMGIASVQMWQRARATGTGLMSPEQRQRRSDWMAHYQASGTARQSFSRTRAGVREDIGPMYYRSAWEANYARYLNWLVEQRQIKSWRYEAVTFWFEAIKRGVRSWKPDFEITNLDDSVEYHEVKGWDYARGQTARKRMAKYYPEVKVVLIDQAAYRALAKWKGLIAEWE